MKSTDQVDITFVNAVLGKGILNGIVNIQLGACNFDIQDDGTVNRDLSVCCRLRMDAYCAVQLRDAITDLLATIENAQRTSITPDRQADESLN